MRRILESVRPRLLLVAIAAAALTVGCGERALQSPTGPSGTLGSATLLADGDDGVATAASRTGAFELRGGNGKGRGNGNQDDAEGEEQQNGNGGGPGRSHEARIVGFVTANAGGVLTVNGRSIAPALDAVIRHGNRLLTIGDIEVGDHVQARGVLEGLTLVATEIKVQDTGHDNGAVDEMELEGVISGLSATSGCPVVTFMIGTTKVTTSAATVFDDVLCSALANGALVEVEGTLQPDGSILATSVEAESGPDEVVGTVFAFSGAASCPAATLKVGPTLSLATTVTLSGTTTFSGVTCATLVDGATVEVEGTRQPDGSIVAASVELK